jgi:hypothetical protein
MPEALSALAVATRAQSSAICLSFDIGRDAISSGTPSSGQLTCNGTGELECLGNHNASTLLEFDRPLATLASPDVALITMFHLELLSFGFIHFNGLQIMNKFDLLVEHFLVRVIATEQLKLCKDYK